jgi:hypothetical protein
MNLRSILSRVFKSIPGRRNKPADEAASSVKDEMVKDKMAMLNAEFRGANGE